MPLTGAHRDKRYVFLSEYLCFLFGRCVESTRTDASYPTMYFLPMPPEASSCFGMISDEGVERAPLSCFSLARGGMVRVSIVSRVEIKKYLEKKT